MSRRYALTATRSPYLDRAALTGRAAVVQMADDLRIFAANCGGVSTDDLHVIGWTRTQIDTLGHKAREHAYAASAA